MSVHKTVIITRASQEDGRRTGQDISGQGLERRRHPANHQRNHPVRPASQPHGRILER